MVEKISWVLNVQVAGGPRASASQAMDVDAYDVITVVIPGGDNATPGTASIEVQPGGAGQVRLLLITSTLYDPALTYSVDGGAQIKLDGLHFLIGSGAVALLGGTQKTFAFTNKAGLDKPASLQIMVGRKAVE